MKPDVTGVAARAWKFQIPEAERARKPHGLDAWLIHQPGVHVFWSWWWLTGCDLYDDDDDGEWGRLPAKKHAAENTHEFLCFALSPESGYFAGTEPPEGWDSTEVSCPARVGRHFMTPPEFIHQDVLRDNEQACEVLRLLVRAVCDGLTAADADFRSRNVTLLANTCDHFRRGLHEVH